MTPRLTGTLLCALAVLSLLPAAASARPRAHVRVAECNVSLLPGASFADFKARMRAVRGTSRMLMRFRLEQRFGSAAFERLNVPELTEWREAEPGVRRFTYTQRVRALQAGGLYRMRVNFRWYGENGKLIERRRRRSGTCGKPGPLPNLRIGDIRARFGSAPGTVEYAVDVLNTGSASAKSVPVTLTVDGATLDERSISELKPGESGTVSFSGPACGRNVRADVDREDAIHESNEDDNIRRVRCIALAAR